MEYIDQLFALRLKKDFISLYLHDQYESLKTDKDLITKLQTGAIKTDEN